MHEGGGQIIGLQLLELQKPIYKGLAAYGHIGREDLNVRFEDIDAVDRLKAFFNVEEIA